MYDFRAMLEKRNMSSFPVSIGTAIALEAVMDSQLELFSQEHEKPSRIDLNNVKYHFFNAYTLLRNIISSVSDKELKDKLLFSRDNSLLLFDTVVEEFNFIKSAYGNIGLVPMLYIPSYNLVKQNNPFGVIENTTDLSTVMSHLNKGLFRYLNTNYKDLVYQEEKIKNVPGTVLITSHIELDLLNNKYLANNLKLLESHTGKLKSVDKFYSKYRKYSNKDLSVIPFDEKLLYIFGGALIKPSSPKIKKLVYEIALKYNWNYGISEMKIVSDLSKEKEVYDFYKKIKRCY